MNETTEQALDATLKGAMEEVLKLRALLKRQREQITLLESQNAEMEAWIDDLQSGMYVNCVYCGHRYGPKEDTPVSMADVLKAHIAKCPKHPMTGLRTALETVSMMALNGVLTPDLNFALEILKEIRDTTKNALGVLDPRTKMTSPGICVVEPCGWLEGWDVLPCETHEEYHKRTRKS